MKAEDFYKKHYGDSESVPKEKVIELLKTFSRALSIERDLRLGTHGKRESLKKLKSLMERLEMAKYQLKITTQVETAMQYENEIEDIIGER